MLKKKFLSVALSALLLFVVLAPAEIAAGEASATPKSMVSVQYVYINQASTSLTISASGTNSYTGAVLASANEIATSETSTHSVYQVSIVRWKLIHLHCNTWQQ